MKSFILVVLFFSFCYSLVVPVRKSKIPIGTPLPVTVVNENIVNTINSAQDLWTASTDQGFVSTLSKSQVKSQLLGALEGGRKLPRKIFTSKKDLPASFDSRTNWPNCWSMRQIRDQSACGSCWAFAAVEAMSDRYCVFKKQNVSISAQDMNSCCSTCGFGCGGGYPNEAWQYWVESGVVTEQCSPYSLPGCDHHIPNSKHPCPSQEYPTPPCTQQCVDGEQWAEAKQYGATAYGVEGAEDVQQEIFQNGPVETQFTVYEDFLSYKSGVYRHTTGGVLGGHAVKMLGWGVTSNGTEYWIIANSWNPDWGNKGYFWILRGEDECGIEDSINAGVPK